MCVLIEILKILQIISSLLFIYTYFHIFLLFQNHYILYHVRNTLRKLLFCSFTSQVSFKNSWENITGNKKFFLHKKIVFNILVNTYETIAGM